MEKKNDIGIIRDSVNGVNKYARIPIRRKRTPICQKEIEEISKIHVSLNTDIETLGRAACLASDLGFPYFAGKIFSYIDMQNGKEYEFIDFGEQSEKFKELLSEGRKTE